MPNVWKQEFSQEIIPPNKLNIAHSQKITACFSSADADISGDTINKNCEAERIKVGKVIFGKRRIKDPKEGLHLNRTYSKLSLFACLFLSERNWTYLQHFHGLLAHIRWRCDMDPGGRPCAAVLMVACGPLRANPALLAPTMAERQLLSEPDLWRGGWWRGGTLTMLVQGTQVWGRTEDAHPVHPKQKEELNMR